MGEESKRTPAGDDRKPDRTATKAAPCDAKRPDEQSDAVSGVPRETYEEAVAEAVQGVHG